MEFSIQPYQFVVITISLFMIYQGVSRYLKHQSGQTFTKVLVRLFVWGGMFVVSLFPAVTTVLAEMIGIEGNINAVILTGFLLIFLMIFKLLSAIERLEQNISDLTRREALKDLNDDQKQR